MPSDNIHQCFTKGLKLVPLSFAKRFHFSLDDVKSKQIIKKKTQLNNPPDDIITSEY